MGYADVRDRLRPPSEDPTPLPPAALRRRVGGPVDRDEFLAFGRRWSERVRAAVTQAGSDFDSLERVLDFGCGCGRTLRWLAGPNGPHLHGTDIDAEAIAWCRANLGHGEFAVNGALPPLDLSPASFDLAYAISVFTHLPADRQAAWLEELRRVVRPGGLVVATVRGHGHLAGLPASTRAGAERNGITFARTESDFRPDWYGDATQTPEWTLARFGEQFEVLDYRPGGQGHRQDIVVMRRPGPVAASAGSRGRVR